MKQMCRLLILVSFLFSGASAVAQTVSISPASVQSPAVGRQLTVSLKIANGANVAGYQATLVFDTSALRYVGSANGDYLPASAIFIPPIVSGNQVPLAATTLVGEANGAGTLATVTFEVIAVKASTLRLTEVLLSDGEGNASRPRVENGQINAPVVPTVNKPDLVVQSPRLSKSTLSPGESFTLSATVANVGSGRAAATTLQYYRSTNSTISPSDTQVGSSSVFVSLGANNNFPRSIILNAPTTPGTYYYGACVDPVPNEADTNNNCSTAVSVTVQSTEPPLERVNIPDTNLRAAIESTLGKASGATLTTADMARLTQLDAQDANIRILTGLEQATNLIYLFLDNNSISDLSALRSLTNLEGLALQSNNISDISPLAGLTNLTGLLLTDNNILNISALARLTNLTQLSLWDNNISNISALARLTNLAELDLDDNNISNISALARLTNLTSLYLEGNSISDLSPLVSNTGLRTGDEVYVRGNPLNSVSINTHIPTLQRRGVAVEFDAPAPAQTVNIPDTNLRAAIQKALGKAASATLTTADMARLTRLVAPNTNIRVLTGLEHATNLTELRLGGFFATNSNSVSDISVISGLTNLTYLSLGGNNVSNISALARLTNLTYLYLYNNNISDISALARLTNLATLRLDGNTISDISPLVSNTGLGQGNTVNVRGNPLNAASINTHIPTLQRRGVEVKFDPPQPVNISDPNLRAAIEKALRKASGATITTADMARLTRLDAPNANIRMLTGLEHATNLTGLNLSSNTISDISALAGLTNLKGLNLWDNTIMDISALAGLTNLISLSLDNNKVTDLSPLLENTGLGQGSTVNVRGNPLNATSINTHIPTLQRRGVNVQFDPPQPVTIPDVNLRAAIEAELGKASGATITPADMTNLTRLDAPNANISVLTGLEHATNLTYLHLGGERVQERWTNSNSVSDISPLAGLTNLTKMWLGDNNISDISPLAGLTNLETLSLYSNRISDISPLAGLTNLTYLGLAGNTLSDLSPLVSNTGLGPGDEVNVKGNPLNAVSINTHIPTLQRRGVDIQFDAIVTDDDEDEEVTVEFDPPQDVSIDGTVDVLIYTGDVWWIEPHEATVEAQTTKHLLQSAGIQAEITENENTVKQWMLQTSSDGSVDVLIIYGILPTTIYPPENVMPDGSVAEKWIETSDGNTILNHADYLGFQSTIWRNNPLGPGVAGHLNREEALQNLMDTPTIFIPRDNISMFVTSEGRTLTPSLVNFQSDRPFPLHQLEGNWFAEKILASNTGNAQATLADPVVLRDGNRGRIAIVHQTFNEDNPKGEVAAEIIINYLLGEPEPPPISDEDVNGDGIVDATDLALVIANLGQTGQNKADVNGDEIVNLDDVLLVSAAVEGDAGDAAAAAPSLHASVFEGISAATVQRLLTQAHQIGLTDPAYLRGISVLEQLLALLLPKETALLPNYPNPFNPETWIPYQLAKPADVTLTIYAINGQVVRRLELGHQLAGTYQSKSRAAYWDGRNQLGEPVASGLYLYTLKAGEFTATRKMLIRK